MIRVKCPTCDRFVMEIEQTPAGVRRSQPWYHRFNDPDELPGPEVFVRHRHLADLLDQMRDPIYVYCPRDHHGEITKAEIEEAWLKALHRPVVLRATVMETVEPEA